MTWKFLVVAESQADAATVSRLADRVISDEVRWADAETLPHVRRCGFTDDRPYFDIHDAQRRARELGFRVRGRFDGLPESHMYRALLLLLENARPDGALIHRDEDDEPDRRKAFESAFADGEWSFPVALAMPIPEIEAWSIAVYEPANERERLVVEDLHAELGFRPTDHAERLTSGRSEHPKDAKRILDLLTGRDPARKALCLDCPIERLSDRGGSTGLRTFIEEVRTRLAPLLLRE